MENNENMNGEQFEESFLDGFETGLYTGEEENTNALDEEVERFVKIYEDLANTLIYDKEYARICKKEDRAEGLSAYQTRQKDIERTITDKKGVCTTFSMRLSKELTSLGIENYLLVSQKPDLIYWVNLYRNGENFVVADITEDIVQGNYLRELGKPVDRIPPISANIPISEFLKENPQCFVVEEIKNDGRKFEELSMTSINEFLRAKSAERTETEETEVIVHDLSGTINYPDSEGSDSKESDSKGSIWDGKKTSSITPESFREREEYYKKIAYDIGRKMMAGESNYTSKIGEFGEKLGIDKDKPNIGITYNNKINELSQIFKTAGISMFAEINEKGDYVSSSFVGDAILDDLASKLSSSLDVLSEYNISIDNVITEKTNQINEQKNVGFMQKLFSKIKELFGGQQALPSQTSRLQDAIEEANNNLSEFRKIDDSIWGYNLNDNVTQSLVSFINKMGFSSSDIPEIVDENVAPVLQKLGLESLIPELQKQLSKLNEQENTKMLKPWELTEEQKAAIHGQQKEISGAYIENNNSSTRGIGIDEEENEK